MSEKNKHIVSEELLFRYFAEEVSPDEQEMVLVWKNESESNLSEFNRIEFFFLDDDLSIGIQNQYIFNIFTLNRVDKCLHILRIFIINVPPDIRNKHLVDRLIDTVKCLKDTYLKII